MLEQSIYISEALVPTSFGWKEMIVEGKDGKEKKQLTLEGEFQRANKPNRNKRVYSEMILRRETDKLTKQILERNGIPMELDHPLPSSDERGMALAQRVSLDNACALNTHLEMHGDVVYGKAIILEGDHGAGDKISAMVRAGYKPAVSSRGLGGKPQQGADGWLVVPEDFNMITYDFVTNPSTHNAILDRLNEELIYEMKGIKPNRSSGKGKVNSAKFVLERLANKYK